LADVRSHPCSAHRPEFNHKNLKKILPEQGIGHLVLALNVSWMRSEVCLKMMTFGMWGQPVENLRITGQGGICLGQVVIFRIGRGTLSLGEYTINPKALLPIMLMVVIIL